MQKQKPSVGVNQSIIDFSKPQQVALWGFGLLGSSFYLALTESLPHWKFRIVDPNIDVESFLSWKNENQLQNLDLINIEQLKINDIFVLAGPVDVNAKHLEEFDFPKNSVVLDLGSTKSQMTDIFKKRGQNKFTYIGGHPLAGKEVSGFINGDPLLFYNKTFCWVTAEDKPSEEIKNTFDALACFLGANPCWLSAQEHDQALAWTSHLPQVLSSVLAKSLSGKKFSEQAELFPGVISNLLRISGSSHSMWKPILESNQIQLQPVLSELIQSLKEVQKDLGTSKICEDLFNSSNDFYKKFKKGV